MIAQLVLALTLLGFSVEPIGTVDSLGFMTGSWVSETDAGRVVIEEHWTPAKAGTLFGVSRTLVEGKTVAFEFLRIESRDAGIFYVAQPEGGAGTEFRLTELAEGRAQFENPEHDHPKIIRYERLKDGSLTARIEGDERGKHVEQAFHFRPAPPP